MTDTHTTNSGNGFMEKYLTPIAVILGAVIIAAAFAFGHGGASNSKTATSTASQQGPAVNIANLKTAGEPFIGNPNAPVTLAVFFDYQCPFCKQFDTTVLAQLYSNYVQQGKVKVVFKDFDFIGPDSIVASEYARAVFELYPNQFYAWYQAVFAAQLAESHAADATYLPHLDKVSSTIPGIDTKKIAALVSQKKAEYDNAITASFSEGQGDGIQGTPSVIVGTTLLQGAQSYQSVAALVDAQLKK